MGKTEKKIKLFNSRAFERAAPGLLTKQQELEWYRSNLNCILDFYDAPDSVYDSVAGIGTNSPMSRLIWLLDNKEKV